VETFLGLQSNEHWNYHENQLSVAHNAFCARDKKPQLAQATRIQLQNTYSSSISIVQDILHRNFDWFPLN